MKISYLKEQQEIENKDELIEKIKSCITGIIVSNPKKVKFFTPSTLFKYNPSGVTSGGFDLLRVDFDKITLEKRVGSQTPLLEIYLSPVYGPYHAGATKCCKKIICTLQGKPQFQFDKVPKEIQQIALEYSLDNNSLHAGISADGRGFDEEIYNLIYNANIVVNKIRLYEGCSNEFGSEIDKALNVYFENIGGKTLQGMDEDKEISTLGVQGIINSTSVNEDYDKYADHLFSKIEFMIPINIVSSVSVVDVLVNLKNCGPSAKKFLNNTLKDGCNKIINKFKNEAGIYDSDEYKNRLISDAFGDKVSNSIRFDEIEKFLNSDNLVDDFGIETVRVNFSGLMKRYIPKGDTKVKEKGFFVTQVEKVDLVPNYLKGYLSHKGTTCLFINVNHPAIYIDMSFPMLTAIMCLQNSSQGGDTKELSNYINIEDPKMYQYFISSMLAGTVYDNNEGNKNSLKAAKLELIKKFDSSMNHK